MEGVHLFHFFMSNCSQRVRFALAEKGVPWTSHHLNLPAREHMTPAYRAINPNAVVPTLVHDGRVVIESNDIIEYVDERLGGPSLAPDAEADRVAGADLLRRSDHIQSAIKALSHELVFKAVRTVTSEDVHAMETEGARPDLVAFMRDFSEDGSAWAGRVATARTQVDAELTHLESRLTRSGDWLSGPALGLADISWSVNAFRLSQARYDTAPYPAYGRWRDRVFARDAFREAVAEYEPR